MTTMGLMAAIAVVVAVLAALTLLPAVLAIIGPQHQLAARAAPPPDHEHVKSGLWAKWAHEIAKRRGLPASPRSRS